MGTRLYPATNNKRILARLSMVPEGTYEVLEEFQKPIRNFNLDPDTHKNYIVNWILTNKQYSNHEDLTAEKLMGMTNFSIYNIASYISFGLMELPENHNICKLDSFLGNGWGKFNLSLLDPARIEGDQISGHTEDVNLTIELYVSSTGFRYQDGQIIDEVIKLLFEDPDNKGVVWS